MPGALAAHERVHADGALLLVAVEGGRRHQFFEAAEQLRGEAHENGRGGGARRQTRANLAHRVGRVVRVRVQELGVIAQLFRVLFELDVAKLAGS
jgi:hypothetical protein